MISGLSTLVLCSTYRETVRDEEQFFFKFFTQKKRLTKGGDVEYKKKEQGPADNTLDRETGKQQMKWPWSHWRFRFLCLRLRMQVHTIMMTWW